VRELEEELGHKPSAEELSAFLELPLEDIHGLLRIAGDGLNVGS
jgi:DNA-directed RNA polymerase specialized sigma subunit